MPMSASAAFAVNFLGPFQSGVRRSESHDCAATGKDSEVDERAEQSAGISARCFSSRRSGLRPGRAPGRGAQRTHDRLCAHILCPPAHRKPTGQRRAASSQQASSSSSSPYLHVMTPHSLSSACQSQAALATPVSRNIRCSVCRL